MGIFSYTPQKPGKGVNKDGPTLRRPFLFFSLMFEKIWDFVKISLLFSSTSLPIITIGPSLFGLTYFSRSITNSTHMFLLSDYWDSFKNNFFKGILISFINIIPLISLIIVYSNIQAVPMFRGYIYPLALINVIMIMMSFYIYPIYLTYDISLFALYKNAFIFALIKFPMNLIFVILYIAIIFLLYGFLPYLGALLSFFFFNAFLNYLTTFYTMPIIEKYMNINQED